MNSTQNIYCALRTLGSHIEPPDETDPLQEEIEQTKSLCNDAAERLEFLSHAVVKLTKRLERYEKSRLYWKKRAKDAENFIALEEARRAVLQIQAQAVMQTLINQSNLS